MQTLEVLSASQMKQFDVPGEAPVVITTPQIQMAVSLEPPGPGSRIFNQPLTAPGSGSAFDPLPADALNAAGDNPVQTTFLSLAFDPHGGSSTDGSSSGMTRLAFGTGGAEVPVAGLEVPITFTLPRAPLVNGTSAQCSFWNADDGEYQTAGCTQIPNPLPLNHTGFWVNGTVTITDEDLAGAWNISANVTGGPSLVREEPLLLLTHASALAQLQHALAVCHRLADPRQYLSSRLASQLDGCTQAILDCQGNPDAKLYLNPMNPFGDGAVSCVNVTRPLRVFYGECHRVARSRVNCAASSAALSDRPERSHPPSPALSPQARRATCGVRTTPSTVLGTQ